MQTILIHDRLLTLPSCYNEATGSQVRAIVRNSMSQMSEGAQKLSNLMILLEPSGRFWLRWRWLFRLRREEALLEMEDFETEVDAFMNSDTPFTAQLFPRLKVGRFRRLHGPQQYIGNLHFCQFRMAEDLCFRYIDTRDAALLDEFIAVLYLDRPYRKLPELTDKQLLQLFDEEAIKARTRLVSSLSLDQKICIFLWYKGCRSALVDQFPKVFRKPKGDDETPAGDTSAPVDIADSYADLLGALAKEAPNYPKWDASPMYDVFHAYSRDVEEAERLERIRKQHEKKP